MSGERSRWFSSWWVIAALLAVAVAFGVLRYKRHVTKSSPAPSASATTAVDDRYAASMITIAHKDVEEYSGLKAKPTRSKAEARELADKILQEARRDPSRFAELARLHSEDPVAHEGGAIPDWKKGEFAASEAVLDKLRVGEVSEPIETEYGFRILRRDRPLPVTTLSARQIVIAWKGAPRAPTSVTRTRDEALARAKELADKARTNPGAFEALARAESDGWDRDGGGYMGVWLTTSKRYPLVFNRAIFSVDPSGVPAPVESMFGYHVFLRVEPSSAPPLAGAHILISYKGAKRAPQHVTRTKDDARKFAESLTAKLKASPVEFAVVARENSDDATASQGGDLGSWKKGEKPAEIDDAFAALRPDEIAGPIETQFGFHVVQRRTAPGERGYGE